MLAQRPSSAQMSRPGQDRASRTVGGLIRERPVSVNVALQIELRPVETSHFEDDTGAPGVLKGRRRL